MFMGALEKKNFVTTEAGVSTTLLDLTGTGHVRSALGQRLHIEPASHGALHSEGLEAVIVIIHQQPQETPTLPRLPREDIRLRLQLFLPIFIHVAVFHHSVVLSYFPNSLNFHDSSLCRHTSPHVNEWTGPVLSSVYVLTLVAWWGRWRRRWYGHTLEAESQQGRCDDERHHCTAWVWNPRWEGVGDFD